MLINERRSSLSWATVLGLGHLRPFPGTWGSLPPVVIGGVLLAVGAGPIQSPWLWHLVMGAIVLLASAGCLLQADRARARFLREDPSQVVADETAGQALALMFLPAAAFATPGSAWWTLVLAFVGFRVFDIVKPFPARESQSIPGGWGILLDDLLAAVYTIVTIHVVVAIVR